MEDFVEIMEEFSIGAQRYMKYFLVYDDPKLKYMAVFVKRFALKQVLYCLGVSHSIISFFQHFLTFNIISHHFLLLFKYKNHYKTKFFIFLYQTFLLFLKKKTFLFFFTSATVQNRNKNKIVYQTNSML